MIDADESPGYTYDELLAEMRSWQKVAGQMNRQMLSILDVVNEMEKSDDYSIREYAERLRLVLQQR